MNVRECLRMICYDMPLELSAKLVFGKLSHSEMMVIIEGMRNGFRM